MSQSKFNIAEHLSDAGSSALRSILDILMALLVCSGVSYFLYSYMGSDPVAGLLHSTLSAPTIVGLLLKGEGLGWAPLAIWAGLCLVAAVISRIIEAKDEPHPFVAFGIVGFLASIALLSYVVHAQGQDVFNLFGHLDNIPDALATLLHVALLQAYVIVLTLAVSSIFTLLTLRVPLIAASLRASSYLLPMLILLPVPLRLFLPDWLNISRVALTKELQPLCDALLLTTRQLGDWPNTLHTLLTNAGIQQHLIAAVVLFAALQLIALLVSFIPHRK